MLKARIAGALGGRAAEQLVFGTSQARGVLSFRSARRAEVFQEALRLKVCEPILVHVLVPLLKL